MKIITKDGHEADTEHYLSSHLLLYCIGFENGKLVIIRSCLKDAIKGRKYYWYRHNAEEALAKIEEKRTAKKVYKTKDGFEISSTTMAYIHQVLPYGDTRGVQSELICDVALPDLHNWYWLHANASEAKEKRDAIMKDDEEILKNKAIVGDDPTKKEIVYRPEIESTRFGTMLNKLDVALQSWKESMQVAAVHDKKVAAERDRKLADEIKTKRLKTAMDFIDKQEICFDVSSAILYLLTDRGSKENVEKAIWFLQRYAARL